MKTCNKCKNRGRKRRCDLYTSMSTYAEKCKDFEEKKQTNADHIRSMSDEDLAELIASGELCAICPVCKYYGTEDCYVENDGTSKNCHKGIIQWLQSGVEHNVIGK